MGKFLLLLVAAAALAAGVTAVQSLTPTTLDAEAKASKQIATVLAEQAAWGGLEEAAEALSSVSTMPTAPFSLASTDEVSGNRYRVVVTPDPAGSLVTARAQGWSGAAGITEGTAIMEVDFALRLPSGGAYEPPPFMRGLVRSNRVINDGGNMTVSSEDPTRNADFYTNEYFNGRGTSSIPGFLYHGGDMSASKTTQALNTFNPPDNPDGLTAVERVDPFTIPYFNPPDYLSMATEVTPSQLSLYGTVELGTKENPKVWYIDGNLNVGSSDVVLEGYGIFIINGSLNVTNQFSVQDSSPAGNSVAFYARDDINVNNEVDLAGQFFANGVVGLSSRSTVTGSITAGQVQFGRNSTLIYREPSAWQTEPLFGASTSSTPVMTPLAYRAWDPSRSI